MRVLFTGHGSTGHVLPMLGVAEALVADGHDVLFATSAEYCTVVAAHGIDTVAAGMTDEALIAEAQARWPETRSMPAAGWTLRMFCEIAAPAMATAVAPVVERWRPDVVVREEGEYGGPLAAAVGGLPWVTHAWGCPLRPPEALADLGRLVAPTWERAGVLPPGGAGLYGGAVLDPCPPSLYAAEPSSPPRHAIRPTPAPAPQERREEGRRRAYLGFGTVPLFRDPGDLLLALVPELLALDFDVTVTTGDDAVAARLRDLGPDRVDVARWVDLGRLMSRCDLVVCHGGAGTVLAALAAGVPLLLLPRGAPSQQRMSAACEARGVGRTAVWTGTNVDGVSRLLSEVASSERMRDAARAVAAEMAAMPDPASAVQVLRALL